MLNKKRLILIVGLVLFAAACNGPEDLSALQDGQPVSAQVEQAQQPAQQSQPEVQVGQDQAATQGQPQVQQPSSASVNNQSAPTDIGSSEALSGFTNPFSDNVTVTFTDEFMVVQTDGLPDHEIDPSVNPNTATAQDFTFYIPLNPQLAGTTTDTPMGQIGIAVSGAVFYNGYNSSGGYAVELEILDHCGGHADQRGVYHYHEQSDCIHGNLIGYAFDGFEVRGNIENDGTAVTGLDACNGHEHDGEYHYHATDDPSKPLLGCYSGIVETSNFVGGGQFGGAAAGGQGATFQSAPTDFQGPAFDQDQQGTGPQAGGGPGPGGGGRGPGGPGGGPGGGAGG